MPRTMKLVKCVVACTGCDGTPTFHNVVIHCDQEQYDNGDHYDAAKEDASENDYEKPMVVFDENDGPEWLFGQFDWDATTVVTL